MNIVKAYGGMTALLQQAARIVGESEFRQELFQDLRYCDALLQRMSQDPCIPEVVRVEVYATLLSAGPGGLLAFVWLLKEGHISAKPLDNYVRCLQVGPPVRDALDERAALEAAGVLMSYKALSLEQQFCFATRLLSCTAFARVARLGLFKRFLGGLLVHPENRLALATWATGGGEGVTRVADELQNVHAPSPGEELFRHGLVARAQMGEDVAGLLTTCGDLESKNFSSTHAEAMLDLLEHFEGATPEEQRQRILGHLRDHSDPKVRRRAYQLAQEFLPRGGGVH